MKKILLTLILITIALATSIPMNAKDKTEHQKKVEEYSLKDYLHWSG